MKTNLLYKCYCALIFVLIVSCDEDFIKDEIQATTNQMPFSIKTVTKAELLSSNATISTVFSNIAQLESRSLQKSPDSVHGLKVLTDLVKVIEKPDDTLTTYTFPTINFTDNRLKNVIVTDKNGAFTTYIITYEKLAKGTTKISKELVSNDNSGFVKNWITIETTFCEWVSFQSPRDFSMGPPEWVCTTTSETWGSGPVGGSGGMNVITQPTYADHTASLKAMSDDPGVKAEIKDWIDNQLITATYEIGTEWIVGGGLNGTLGKRPAVLIGNEANGAYFGNVLNSGTVLRNHLHFNGLAPMFSGFDLFAHLGFFSQNNSGNFFTDSSQTTSMVVSSFGINPATNKAVAGVYAMRILNSDNAISDLTRLQTPDP